MKDTIANSLFTEELWDVTVLFPSQVNCKRKESTLRCFCDE